MKTARYLCVLALVGLLAGCGGDSGGRTPQDTFEYFKGAMADKDFARAWDMLSAQSQRLINEDAAVIAESARKSEGPGLADAQAKAKAMGLSVDKLRDLDGKSLFIGLYTMTADKGRDEWEKVSRGQFVRADVDGDRCKAYISMDGKVDEEHPLPMVKEEGVWKVDLSRAK